MRITYLLDVYLFATIYHTLFEVNVSKLRYPEKGWTPVNITDDTVLVDESRKIIEIIDRVELFETVEEFIKGEITKKRSEKIYDSLRELFNLKICSS